MAAGGTTQYAKTNKVTIERNGKKFWQGSAFDTDLDALHLRGAAVAAWFLHRSRRWSEGPVCECIRFRVQSPSFSLLFISHMIPATFSRRSTDAKRSDSHLN